MELTAKLLPQMIEMHKKGNFMPMMVEALLQDDYDSFQWLGIARKSGDFKDIAKFYAHHGWKADIIESWHKTMQNSVMLYTRKRGMR